MQSPHAEYILIKTRQSGKEELYSADSLEDIRAFIEMKAGTGRLAADGKGGDVE